MIASLRGLFVTGTDTGVGKTRVASAIATALTSGDRRVGVLKPVATGVTREGDVEDCEDARVLAGSVPIEAPLERIAPFTVRGSPGALGGREGRGTDTGARPGP